MDPVDEPKGQQLAEVSGQVDMSATQALARWQDVRGETRTDIAALRQIDMPPAQVMAAPGGGATDYLARTSGAVGQRFFVYRDGRMDETAEDGSDVRGTYDLALKELVNPEEHELQRLLTELDTKRHDLESFELQPDRQEDAASHRARIAELEARYRELRETLPPKREELESGIMAIPVGTVLFISVQNADDLFPVLVVEDDGVKWLETMADLTPNGLVRGGTYRKGFRYPLTNFLNGGLYLPTGVKGNARNLRQEDVPRLEGRKEDL